MLIVLYMRVYVYIYVYVCASNINMVSCCLSSAYILH